MLDFDLDKLPMERTLGVMWDSETDVLTFKIKRRKRLMNLRLNALS